MRIIFIWIFFVLSLPVQAVDKIVIGCTTKCDIFLQIALKQAARSNNISVEIIDISSMPKSLLTYLDGILIPGGADIDPRYYFSAIEQPLIDYTKNLDKYVKYSQEGRKRDPFEFKLLKDYFSDDGLKNLPILGICRGMQMLGVSQGIPLYVDLKKEFGIRNRRYLFDRIHVENADSLMSQMFNHSFLGFKKHHQGLRVSYFKEHKDRWPNLEITSYSNKGIIAESLEFSDRPVLGVQFHPENDFGYERRTIFNWFIAKAKQRFKEKLSLDLK